MIARLATLALTVAGCTVLNASDACDGDGEEVQINERGDEIEHVGHPQAAAVLGDGRVIFAYVSTRDDQLRSEVRIAIVESPGGTRNLLCRGTARELVVSDVPEDDGSPEALAYGATVAAVDLSNPLGGDLAVAAVGWSIGTPGSPDAAVRIRFVDSAGCPLGPTAFSPVPEGVTDPQSGLSLATAENGRALLATFQDGRRALAAFIRAFGSASDPIVLGEEDLISAEVVSAVAPDGRAIAAWTYQNASWLKERQIGIRAALFDGNGTLLPAALADGAAEAFRVDRGPSLNWSGHPPSLGVAVAAAEDRYAVVFATSDDAERPWRVRATELDARDGARLRFEGSADGDPLPLDPSNDAVQASPSATYLPDGSLLALWESGSEGGTVGRLFGPDGAARFTGVGCDEGPFVVGARADVLPGTSSAVVADGQAWILHSADTPEDAFETAVMGWRMNQGELYPARR